MFHFDFYSVALSKLHRGNEKDLADVVNMVQQQLIEKSRLRDFFEALLPAFETFRIGADPERLARNFVLFEERLMRRP